MIWEKDSLFNLIIHQPDIDKIYTYAKDPSEANYQFFINKEKVKDERFLTILKFLLNIRIIWTIFTKILKNTIQLKKKNL